MTCLKHLGLKNPKPLTFDQLIQTAIELELEINKLNKHLQSTNPALGKTPNRTILALEYASEHVPHIIEWIRTAQKETPK